MKCVMYNNKLKTYDLDISYHLLWNQFSKGYYLSILASYIMLSELLLRLVF